MPFILGVRLRALVLFALIPSVLIASDSDDDDRKSRRSSKSFRSSQSSESLRSLIQSHDVDAVDTPEQNPKHVALGRLLFFDRIICGNQDTACATCHHPLTNTTDSLALGVGTGSPSVNEVGIFRVRGEEREFIPRNAPDLFNRGSVHWTSMFWDSRVSTESGVVVSPAGDALPGELQLPLQIQAMFPPTSRDEMRGSHEDVFTGNEIAAVADDNFKGIWEAIFNRIIAIDEYQELFLEAFPDVDVNDLGFQHAAIALAAFETEAFGMNDSPFDQFLRGDNQAMSPAAKRGAKLFFGKASCVDCHSGTLLTDQLHHNLAVPQLGPGKNPLTGLDVGRAVVTGDPADEFAFRTPALRNVAATGPWMHNGACSSLEDVILHHLEPDDMLEDYSPRQQLLQVDLHSTVVTDEDLQEVMLDGSEQVDVDLDRREIRDLIEFLHSLTAPDLSARLQALIPDSVPSGNLEDGLGQ